MSQGVGKRLSKEEKYSAASRYQGGESAATIALSMGVSDVAIRATLKRLGVAMRDGRECHRIYTCNPSVITHATVEGAYWLGFFAADGYVSDEGRIELALANKDKEHVLAFRDFLQSNHPTHEKKKVRATKFDIRHPDLVEAFAKYGIGPRKSFTLRIHPDLENNIHFWRGLVDGDGSLFLWQNCPRIGLVGSEQATWQFKSYCLSVVPGASITHEPHRESPVWYTWVHADAARVISAHLYKVEGPALARKRAIALSWADPIAAKIARDAARAATRKRNGVKLPPRSSYPRIPKSSSPALPPAPCTS